MKESLWKVWACAAVRHPRVKSLPVSITSTRLLKRGGILLLQSINVWQVCILHRYLRGLNTIIFLSYTTVTDFLDRNRCEEGVTLALFCASLSRLGLWHEGPAGQSDAEPTTPGTWWPHYFAHGLSACV